MEYFARMNGIKRFTVLFLQMMNNMGGEDELPDMDGADDVRSFLPLLVTLNFSSAILCKKIRTNWIHLFINAIINTLAVKSTL